MFDTFACIQEQYESRHEFTSCLMSIKENFEEKKYVETVDICTFLSYVKKPLFHLIDTLNKLNDRNGVEIIVDDVYDVLLAIRGKTDDKPDILEEFNVINELLADFDMYTDLKHKLAILKEVNVQCKIYQERIPEEIQERKTVYEEIEEDDYNFLLD